MPSTERTAEWRRAPYFAEIAEALNVATNDVLAAWSDEDGMTAMFTRGYTDETSTVLSARLGRDTDGILRAGVDADTGLLVADLFKGRAS